MADWQAALSTPAGHAAGVVALAALAAGYFFRVASVTEQEMRDHNERP
jgi:hypothetical protein